MTQLLTPENSSTIRRMRQAAIVADMTFRDFAAARKLEAAIVASALILGALAIAVAAATL